MLPRPLVSLVVCLSLAPLAAGAAPIISSTFDGGLDGWTAVGFGDPSFTFVPPSVTLPIVDTSPDMEWSATGGNPGGFAKFVDAINEPSSLALAPSQFLGDLTDYIGGTLSFQHNLIMEGAMATGFAPYAVIIASGPISVGGSVTISQTNPASVLVWTFLDPPPMEPPIDTWRQFDITLDVDVAGGLELLVEKDLQDVDPDFPSVTLENFGISNVAFDDIMSNVTFMALAFELVDNNNVQDSEMGGIDNVFLRPIPEPGTGALLALGLAGLAVRKRRS